MGASAGVEGIGGGRIGGAQRSDARGLGRKGRPPRPERQPMVPDTRRVAGDAHAAQPRAPADDGHDLPGFARLQGGVARRGPTEQRGAQDAARARPGALQRGV